MRSVARHYQFTQKPGEIVKMSDGTEYKVAAEGWRKVRPSDRKYDRILKKAKPLY